MAKHHYECDQCGACCLYFPVQIHEKDAEREPLLSLHLIEYPYGKWINWPVDRGCPLLSDTGSCSVDATKPYVCSRFPAGGAGCQWARGRTGLEMLNPIYKGQEP